MRKKKIYISGPIAFHDLGERRKTFAGVKESIEKSNENWEAVNPLENGLPETASRERHMKKDIETLLKCQAIFLLRGWNESTGARVEYLVAKSIGLEIYKQEEL